MKKEINNLEVSLRFSNRKLKERTDEVKKLKEIIIIKDRKIKQLEIENNNTFKVC